MQDSPSSSGAESSHDLDSEVSRRIPVRDTIDFISDVGGHRTRWSILIAVSVVVVCFIGYAASHILFNEAQSSETTETQMEIDPNAGQPVPHDAGQATGAQSLGQSYGGSEKPKIAFSFSFQSEAEAASERDFSVGTDLQRQAHESGQTQNALLYDQVKALLKAASDAVRSENLESFLALLDENETSFVRLQKLKAKVAFRQFEKIDGTYSDVKIKVLNDDELAVNLHCKVNADFAKSGRRIVLFDDDQSLTLRKTPGTMWKICAIEE